MLHRGSPLFSCLINGYIPTDNFSRSSVLTTTAISVIGTSLGPYKIVEQLGAGGMGEVYLGEDTRLGRKVAIKVLPAEFAADPERLARFEQEARAAAALNHPHIAVVHDIGTENDTHFMVQEYLEGQSLRERLDKGALPLDKALDLATEVGEALIAAHKAGIIHRDLKPDNIFVTEDGHAKVLDFGLAKLIEMSPVSGSASMSPTMLGTVAGQVMGTVGYMAPEQIGGEEIDQRADLFAFGCVLYQTVTGRQAFSGRNVMQTLDLILAEEPVSLGEIDSGLPAELERIVRKSLAKEPDKRYQTAADLVVDLRAVQSEIAGGTAQSVAALGGGREGSMAAASDGIGHGTVAMIAVAAALVAAVAVWAALRSPAAPAGPPMTFTMELPPGTGFDNAGRHLLAFSADGKSLVFAANAQLYLHNMAKPGATPIRGTENGGRSPFFSPDGRRVGFWAENGLRTVPVNGGVATPLCETDNPWGASWTEDGRVIWGRGPRGIWQVADTGGTPEQIIEVDEGESAHGPQLLPGGTTVLFTLSQISATWDDARIVVEDLETGNRTVLFESGSDARYLSTGHLVYIREETLWAVGFDPVTLTVGPEAHPVVEGVAQAEGDRTGAGQFSVSDQGTLAFVRGGASVTAEDTLVWIDPGGGATEIATSPGNIEGMRLAPGDRYAAVQVVAGDGGLWIYEFRRELWTRLADVVVGDVAPVWSPNGEYVYFGQSRGDESGLYRRRFDGSEGAEQLMSSSSEFYVPTAISSGRLFYYSASRTSGGFLGHWVVDLEALDDPHLILEGGDQRSLDVHPTGRWVAYHVVENTTPTVYVSEFAAPGSLGRRYSIARGSMPTWSADGTRLYFRDVDRLLVADVKTDPEFEPGLGETVVDGMSRVGIEYDIASDGRVLAAGDAFVVADASNRSRIDFIVNWFEALKEQVPARR